MNLGFFKPIQYLKHKNTAQAGASFDFLSPTLFHITIGKK